MEEGDEDDFQTPIKCSEWDYSYTSTPSAYMAHLQGRIPPSTTFNVLLFLITCLVLRFILLLLKPDIFYIAHYDTGMNGCYVIISLIACLRLHRPRSRAHYLAPPPGTCSITYSHAHMTVLQCRFLVHAFTAGSAQRRVRSGIWNTVSYCCTGPSTVGTGNSLIYRYWLILELVFLSTTSGNQTLYQYQF